MRKRIPNVCRFIGRLGFVLVVLGTAYSTVVAGPTKTSVSSGSYWIENTGQWEGDFQFKCEVGPAVYYVTPKGMTVDFREYHRYPKARSQNDPLDSFGRDSERDSVTVSGHVVQIHYVGAESKLATGDGLLSHYSNYFFGRDSTNWRSRVSHYQTVVAEEVWPGIDVEYRVDKQGIETIYHVQPGADPTQIQIDYLGLDAPLGIDSQGNLVLTTSFGKVKELAPYAYQMEGRTQKRIESTYRIIDTDRVAFEFEVFDVSKEMVIDPLLYGTYLGGGNVDECHVVCPAPNGGAYVAGGTRALSGFPTTPGAYDESGQFDGEREFVCWFGPNGEFIASTLYGVAQTQSQPHTRGGAWAMVYDSVRAGLWIGGYARDNNWPLTPDAYDTVVDEIGDGFIMRFDDSLTDLQYCSFLGGNSTDLVTTLDIGRDGNLCAAGETYSSDFPVTPDAIFTTHREYDCFVWVYDFTSREVVFSTYFGGSRSEINTRSIQVDQEGVMWFVSRTQSDDLPVTEDAFQQTIGDSVPGIDDVLIAGISLGPPTIVYCSYLGGSGGEEPFTLSVVDSDLYVAGRTNSVDFPVSPDAYDTTGPEEVAPNYWDAFVSRLNWRTSEYVGTFFGGSGGDLYVQNTNWVHDTTLTLLGFTDSDNLPVTPDAYQSWLRFSDGFVTKLSTDLCRLNYCSYLGGSGIDGYEFAYVVNADSLWTVGATQSNSFPTTPDGLQRNRVGLTDGFVQYFAIDTTADTTSSAHNVPIPSDFTLAAFPNPFNSTTTLAFYLPKASEVKIVVHDVLGREVIRNHLGRLNVGQHEYHLDGSNWASGIYFVTLDRNSIRTSVKLALVN
ncbi:MAG: T9SS type A sorting domain-containing protein [Calditrichaeota bacterium]|nr:T9SS type A sorting domain-containing protein [Calditrichota bacterium]MCB9367552.1 T9SS type A sorting domain-containing protein [Calditrichota bacterium]